MHGSALFSCCLNFLEMDLPKEKDFLDLFIDTLFGENLQVNLNPTHAVNDSRSSQILAFQRNVNYTGLEPC